MAAAALMLEAGVGILRTQPPPDAAALRAAAADGDRARRRLAGGASYPEFIRAARPGDPGHAAIMHEATRVGRGATYTPFDGAPPAEMRRTWAVAAPYAHATAPLRRLQDRYVSECCLAPGARRREWVREGLRACRPRWPPGRAARTPSSAASSTSSRPCCSPGREGERFARVVIDDGPHPAPRPGRAREGWPARPRRAPEVVVRLDRADPKTRTVGSPCGSAPGATAEGAPVERDRRTSPPTA